MNDKDFEKKYENFTAHEKISIVCDGCGRTFTPLKTRAKQTIKKNNNMYYFCPPCGKKHKYSTSPMSEETKKKISDGIIRYHNEKNNDS